MDARTQTTYPGLNALRGVAAVAVVVGHGGPYFFKQVAPNYYLAVDLFFALSGFVIANAYDRRLAGGLGWVEFMKIRLVRFYPLYLLGVAAGLAVEGAKVIIRYPDALGAANFAASAGLGLLFLPSPTNAPGALFPIDMPAWTLFLELAVNAAYAIGFRFMRTWVLIAVSLVSIVPLAAHAIEAVTLNLGSFWSDGVFGLARAGFAFPLGVLLYRYRRTLLRLPGTTLGSSLVLAVLLAMPSSGLFGLGFALVGCPLLLCLAASDQPSGVVLASSQYLGALSYGIYVLHFPLIQAANYIAAKSPLAPAAVIVGAFLALAGGCIFLDRYFDMPARRWLSSRVLVRPAAGALQPLAERIESAGGPGFQLGPPTGCSSGAGDGDSERRARQP